MPLPGACSRLARCGVAAVAAVAAAPVAAVSLYLSHAYGEFVDRGATTAFVYPTDSGRFDCPAGAAVERSGARITVKVRAAAGAGAPGACHGIDAPLGTLAVGRYDVVAELLAADGTAAQSASMPLVVLPIEGRCNPEPELSPSIWGRPHGATAAEFVARVAADPDFAAALGHPAVRPSPILEDVYLDYPPLDDIPPALDRLVRSGAFASLARNGYACFATSPPDTIAKVEEFFHAGLGQYHYAGDAAEIAAIDAGRVGPWTRTGQSFRVVAEPGCRPSAVDTVVYRFHGRPAAGIGAHFFTRDRAECHAVNASARWEFEGVAFRAAPLLPDGTCAAPAPQSRVPLYRVWRPFGDSTHRLTTDRAVVAQMVAQGWVDEGAAMCVLPPS
jgi:hypothetical protein